MTERFLPGRLSNMAEAFASQSVELETHFIGYEKISWEYWWL
jgi:hypothetical protein